MKTRVLLFSILAGFGLSVRCSGADTPVRVGDRLQVMWDDAVLDLGATTATRELHHPVYAGVVMVWDKPWEGDGSEFPTILVDKDAEGSRLYRMYYLGWNFSRDILGPKQVEPKRYQICYAESRDGIFWTRPNLGLAEFEGHRENNIVLSRWKNGAWTGAEPWSSNFGVFIDTNPSCPEDERYKALSSGGAHASIDYFTSSDGIHFRHRGPLIRREGRRVMFDTHLKGFWHKPTKRYHVYTRGHRPVATNELAGTEFDDLEIRQVRHAAFDCLDRGVRPTEVITCTVPDGGPVEDYPLYTSCVFPYPRNPDLIVGFPTRYNQRGHWQPNYDQLPDPESRRKRCRAESRMGLAITEALFMVSRDGQNFLRYDEAFMTPGRQRPGSWLYGSCYPAAGVLFTPAADGSGDELSLYVPAGNFPGESARLERYTLRIDGFVSRRGTYRGQRVVTKPFLFTGDQLLMNFSSSARGGVTVKIEAEGMSSVTTTPMFGDRIDALATFPDGALEKFAGKPVRLVFNLRDADLYSFRFAKTK